MGLTLPVVFIQTFMVIDTELNLLYNKIPSRSIYVRRETYQRTSNAILQNFK